MSMLTDTLSAFQNSLDTLSNKTDTIAATVAQAAHGVVDDGHALPPLISDLALILVVAAAVTLLFRKLKQPLVLGYIIAGFLVSPHLGFTPSVIDMENVEIWAKIGVIFLLFSLGLEFSFKKLMRVGGSASITAIVEIVFIVLAGFGVGKLLGWSTMNCLFLGGMLASSSTTIILKAFDDLGEKTKGYTKIVFGVLVVEDLVVILLMVLLSTVAVTQNFEGSEMLFTIGKLGFFLVLWFILGIFLIPTMLKKMRNLLDDETYLVLSIGLCLAMVVLATSVGFSAELGAFIMGSIFAETTSAERIEHILKPVKDLFGAVFFVSIGMMINPPLMLANWWVILIVTALVIFGKFFSTTAGALLSGQPLKQSVQVGMSMAQIGEFAFIVATLGLSLGVIDASLFPVAVGASVITTFTTPYMIKYSDHVYRLLNRILPRKLLTVISNYSTSSQTIQAESEWKIMIRKFITSVLTNSIIVLAIMVIATQLLFPVFLGLIENRTLASVVTLSITLAVSSPFLWALMFRHSDREKYKEIWSNTRYVRGPLLIMEIVRILIGVALMGYVVDRLFSTWIALVAIIPLILFLLILFSRSMQKFYNAFETRFITNFNSREIAEEKKKAPMAKFKREFAPNADAWDVHLVDLEVGRNAEYIGRTLNELNWRESHGINVVYIKRGEVVLYAPGPTSKLLPFDHIGVIASDEQIKEFLPVFDAKEEAMCTNCDIEDIVIEKIVVDEHNHLNGVQVKDSDIRERTDGMVVGIERGQERILNPGPNEEFEEGDIVWIVGEKRRLKVLNS